jgi:hypothetical protein
MSTREELRNAARKAGRRFTRIENAIAQEQANSSLRLNMLPLYEARREARAAVDAALLALEALESKQALR